MRELGSWIALYNDGTSCWQYDTTHPGFLSDGHGGGEVPYRAIDWSKVSQLKLESQWATATFDVTPPPEGYSVRLQSRHFRAVDGTNTMCFMIVTLDDTKPLNMDDIQTYVAATVHVTYWFPNGVVHDCPHFECADASRYGMHMVHGKVGELMPETHSTTVGAIGTTS
jgi:hypothetical protein